MNLKAKIEDVLVALAANGEVSIHGFGKFTVRRMKPRDFYIPSTGETRTIPARDLVAFKPSIRLAAKLDRCKDIAEQIADVEQQIARLEAKYGKGVRPEWVGEDIGQMMAIKRSLLADLSKLSC